MAIEFGSPNMPEMVNGKHGTVLGADWFNPLHKRVDGRLHLLEEVKASWLEAVDLLTRQGLTRLDTVLAPAFDKLGRVLELGFLVAESDTEISLAINGNRTFVLLDNEQTSLFTPSQMVSIQRKSDPTTWAIAQVAAPFNRQTRELQVLILSFAGAAGPFDDWEVGALAGSTIAQYAMLQTVLAIGATVETARAQVLSNAATVLSVAEAIQEGPVASVNGKTGIIVLTPADVGAAVAGHSHTIAAISGLESALAGKATPGQISAAITALVFELGLGGLDISGGEF